jgi:succinate dehydrogenase/fumarate reductase flavoprotein subunit
MSTTSKEQVKQEQEIATSSSKQQVQQREQLQAINKALDETKNNIRRTTDEARKDIPHYAQIVNEYQEETIQAARQMADNYLESQREIINSLQSAWLPQIDAANRAVTSNWTSPRNVSEHYERLVSAFADNTIAVTKLVNSAMFANLDAFKRSVQNARDNVKEFSRIGVNSSKTLEQVSRDTTATTTTTFSP